MTSSNPIFGLDDDELNPRRQFGEHMMIAGPDARRTPAELPGIDVPNIGGTSNQPSAVSSQPEGSAGGNPKEQAHDRPMPIMAGPGMNTSTMPTISASMAPPRLDPLEADRERHQTELSRLRSSGSGISQIHNPFLRGMARVGDIAGSMLFPYQMRMIPGTEFHHRSLMNDEAGAINQDLGERQKQAQTEEEEANTAEKREQVKKTEADLNAPLAQTPEEQAFEAELKKNGGDAMAAFRAMKQAGEKAVQPKEGEMPLGDRVGQLNQMLTRRYQLAHPGDALPAQYILPPNATQKDFDRIDKGLESEERAITAGRDREESMQIRREMLTLAKQNQSDREQAAAEKKNKPTPDEQKRADLARNMNENLDALEEILTRRPDLFGPFAGRSTSLRSAIGSNDPDIGALQTIKHQLGMVQQSTHGMRSSQGVEAAAHSIVNNFNSQPAAMKGAIEAARRSVKTFIDDANRGAGGGAGKTLTRAQIEAGAKAHNVTYDQAKKDAESQGYKVQE